MDLEQQSSGLESADKNERKFLVPEGRYFDEFKNTLLLDVDKQSIDLESLRNLAEEKGLEPKNEFHITVLGFKNGGEIKKVLKVLSAEQRLKVISQIKILVENTNWSFAFEPQKYHISKEYLSSVQKGSEDQLVERREAIIQMVTLPEIQLFYDKLNSILGIKLEIPPNHITLYTGGSDKEKSKMGIGINSLSEFLKMNPELIS